MNIFNIFKIPRRFRGLEHDVYELRKENLRLAIKMNELKQPKRGQTWLFNINGQEIDGMIYWSNDEYWVNFYTNIPAKPLKDLKPIRQV